MAMPGQQGVDPVNLGQGDGCVFHPLTMLRRADARMAERQNDVGALLFHLGYIGAGGFDDVAGLNAALQMPPVPIHDLRGHKSDQPDADCVGLSRAICHLPVQDHIRRDQCFIARGARGHFGDHIGRNDREFSPGQGFHQKAQAIVELVIAQGRCVKAQGVHRLNDGVQIAFFHSALIGDVIAHRIALQKVAIIDQQGVFRLGPDLRDMGRGAGQTDAVIGAVRVIIIGKDMHMQVGRFHNAQMGLTGLGAGGKGMRVEQGCSCKAKCLRFCAVLGPGSGA